MTIETWEQFIDLLNHIYPLAKPLHKPGLVLMKGWAQLNRQRHTDILPVNIDNAKNLLIKISPYLPDDWAVQTRSGLAFLSILNIPTRPNWFTTQAGCQLFDYYWYDNDCHAGIKPKPKPPPIPAPPLPPPKPEPEPEPPPLPIPIPVNGEFQVWIDMITQFKKSLPAWNLAMKATCDVMINVLKFFSAFIAWQKKK